MIRNTSSDYVYILGTSRTDLWSPGNCDHQKQNKLDHFRSPRRNSVNTAQYQTIRQTVSVSYFQNNFHDPQRTKTGREQKKA